MSLTMRDEGWKMNFKSTGELNNSSPRQSGTTKLLLVHWKGKLWCVSTWRISHKISHNGYCRCILCVFTVRQIWRQTFEMRCTFLVQVLVSLNLRGVECTISTTHKVTIAETCRWRWNILEFPSEVTVCLYLQSGLQSLLDCSIVSETLSPT